MSALVLCLPAQSIASSTEFAYATTRDGATADAHGSAQAALLPPAARAGTEVVAVVPAAMLSWHRVALPRGTSAGTPRLRAVLEGLLEDQLLDEPEALHLAVQPQLRPAMPVWVAACDRGWLRDALQALEMAGHAVTRIVPEFAPEDSPMLYALGDPQRPALVLAGPDGVMTLPLSAQALPLLPALAPQTPCVAEPAVAALAEQVLQRPVTLEQSADRWLRAARSDWDLAQFEFSSSGRSRALKRLGTAWADVLSAPQWRPVRWGAVLLVALNGVGLNAWAWRERAALQDKRDAIRLALTQTFPQVKVVVDAPVQMEREVTALRQLTGAASGRDLEAMLAAVATAAPPSRMVGGVDFAQGELRIKGLTLSADEARNVSASLKSQGYTAAMRGDALTVTTETLP